MEIGTAILEIVGLSKSFNGINAVNEFSLSVKKGKIYSLIGPNGAGKTTVFNIINGFITPDEGQIFFNGQKLNGLSPYEIANRGIARTFQDLRLLHEFTVLENVLLAFPNQVGERFWGGLWGMDRKEESINRRKAMAILEFVGLPDKANDRAENLSYGQQKLLTIACALAMEAQLLLLDEPVAGIHPSMVEKILLLIKDLQDQGKTIFLIEHDLEVVMQISDWVVVMDEGKKIAEGGPSIIKGNPTVIEAYIG
jgi:branched-chain amino acid transport system ATP-binding protein